MKQIKIMDTTLRDGHQSLWATRMRTAEMLPIIKKLDRIGYWSLETWGGATFDVPLRFLDEDPWERLYELRKRTENTQLQMLLRGQNIVGYRNYPDDLLQAFIERAAKGGIDVFRIFDALNDIRNLSAAIRFVKEAGKHAQGVICYTTSPVHTIDLYLNSVREQVAEGIDSICIKDMAGILSPNVAYELVAALKNEFSIPVHLHCHASSGMAVVAYVKAIEAGVDIIDCAHAPLAGYTSQPAVETLVAALEGTEHDPRFDLSLIEEISQYLADLVAEWKMTRDAAIDRTVIAHQIPGGMTTNLSRQLQEQGATDRLSEVLEEVPLVRAELGYPPLVTPTSQIVGAQAVFNVLAGERYKVVPQEVQDYVKGLYGRSPGPISDEIKEKIIGDAEVVSIRPADLLEPVMERARQELPPELIDKEEDIISYAIFPEIARHFFEGRHNPSIKGGEREEKMNETKHSPSINSNATRVIRELIEITIKNNITELEWEHAGTKVKIRRGGSVAPPAPTSGTATAETASPVAQTEAIETEKTTDYEEITAPLVGVFYRRPAPDQPPFVEQGDIIEAGQTVCIVEAMKLKNEIQTEKRCRIAEIVVDNATTVEYGQVLFRVEPIAD